jgi:tetratricopeptide (TPR) repeat protein
VSDDPDAPDPTDWYWTPYLTAGLHNKAWFHLHCKEDAAFRDTCRFLRDRYASVEDLRHPVTVSVLLGQELGPLPGLLRGSGPLVVEHSLRQIQISRVDDILWTALLVPDHGLDPADLVRLAESHLKSAPDSWSYQESLGAAYYRAGQYAKAAEHLERAVKLFAPGPDDKPTNWQAFFLDMVYNRLNQPDQANLWQAKATRPDAKDPWVDRLIFDRLASESARLRMPKAKPE